MHTLSLGLFAALMCAQAQVGEHAEWVRVSDCIPPSALIQAVSFNGRIVLAGQGMVSEDGRNWIDYGDDLDTSGNAATVFNDKLWSLGGGWDPQNATAKVLSSTDGLHWEEPSFRYEAPWGVRTGLSAVAFDGYIWIIGGVRQAYVTAPQVFLSDVWRSSDGENWELVADSAPWGPRAYHRSVVFDGQIWVIAGFTSKDNHGPIGDIWSSKNGVDWTLAVPEVAWLRRDRHTATVHDDKMWIIGGSLLGVGDTSDVWYSGDGLEWHMQTDAAPWGRRSYHSAVSFNGELLVIGGLAGRDLYRDVWALTTAPPPLEPLVWHSADQNQDKTISLSELLRVIQFYNYRRVDIAFHCDCESEDGYDPQGGVTTCDPHTSDYSPQDWHINLNELLRLIQFFNGGGYHACPDAASEDGFCLVAR